MELRYPINFEGLEDGEATGDVLTRFGEYLGTWKLVKDEDRDTGVYHFFADGQSEPMFSEIISILGSGLICGMALSDICRRIRDWHIAENVQS